MNKQRKLVVVNDNCVLPELGYISGPIITPTKIQIENILKLIKNGRKVYECNPIDKNERVKLTLENVMTDNFASAEKKEPEKTDNSPEKGSNNKDINIPQSNKIDEPVVKPETEEPVNNTADDTKVEEKQSNSDEKKDNQNDEMSQEIDDLSSVNTSESDLKMTSASNSVEGSEVLSDKIDEPVVKPETDEPVNNTADDTKVEEKQSNSDEKKDNQNKNNNQKKRNKH